MNVARVVGSAVTGVLLLAAGSARAQEHYTEGPVWECSAYRTEPDQFNAYMKWLRNQFIPTAQEAKKQGLVLDTKIFVQTPREPTDWDVSICSLYPSFGKALDYDKGDDDRYKAIAAKQYKTPDEDKQREQMKPRLALRKFLGTSFLREVNLRPPGAAPK
jgi:hypothetical protein